MYNNKRNARTRWTNFPSVKIRAEAMVSRRECVPLIPSRPILVHTKLRALDLAELATQVATSLKTDCKVMRRLSELVSV